MLTEDVDGVWRLPRVPTLVQELSGLAIWCVCYVGRGGVGHNGYPHCLQHIVLFIFQNKRRGLKGPV